MATDNRGAYQQVPPVQRFGDAVLLHGQAVAEALYLISRGVRDLRRNDGIEPSPRLRSLLAALADAAETSREMSRPGHGDVPARPTSAQSVLQELSTAQAAKLLDRSPRQLRRMVDELGGRRAPSGALVFERGAIEAAVLLRKESA